MKQSSRCVVASVLAIGAGMTLVSGGAAGGKTIQSLNARVVATSIPGASAIAQIGDFLNDPDSCAKGGPIQINFPSFITAGAVLDPVRLLVGSQSNFGAPLDVVGQEGSFLSIDPSGRSILDVPSNFARNIISSAPQASTLGGAVQMFATNNSHWLNSVNNKDAVTAKYTGVSNPLGLSNNNAFGRIWPANAPFGDTGEGSSSILDPTGLPLKGAPNPAIGGVYVGNLTNRDVVAIPSQPQVIPGALNTGAVGTALLGPSPDRTATNCKAVFAVVTADGAIVQEHTQKGLDGLAPKDTVQSILGRSWDPPSADVDPRFGVIMNPYIPESAPSGTVRQLFVSEPFNDKIAVINLVIAGTAPNQVFGLHPLNPVTRFSSPELNTPVDLAPAQRDIDDKDWASNTTLHEESDFYVANRGDNTIVRMAQDGTVVAVGRVVVPPGPLNNASLNGIATSTDGKKIYLTFTRPGHSAYQGGVLEVPALCAADHPCP
jgi:hypothetical protein